MSAALAFLFIVAIPLVAVAGALVTLFAVGALFDAFENPAEISGRIEAAFRGRLAPSQPAPADHYYQAYWAKKP